MASWALGPRGKLGPQFFRTPLVLAGAWDGLWYRRIATSGYLFVPGRQSDPAFFPAYPILLRGLHAAGLPVGLAGVLVSNVSLGVAAVAFYELGRRVVDDGTARRAACFLAISPLAFVLSMNYPEGLALALLALGLLAAVEGRWGLAAAAGAAAGLVRPEAVIFAIPVAAIAWSRRGEMDPATRGRALAAVLAAPVGLATYPLYLAWALGDPGAWGQAESFWGRAFRASGPVRAFGHLPRMLDHQPWLGRDLAFLVVYAILLVAARRAGVGLPWIVAGALVLVVPLLSGTVQSEGRFGLLALPVYWGIAGLARGRRTGAALRGACVVLLVAGVLTLPYAWP
jgi:hypothetical protein